MNFLLFLYKFVQKTSFQGLSLQDAKRVVFNSLVAESTNSIKSVRKRAGLEIAARTASAKNIEVEVDKPLGLTLGQKQGGGVIITVSIYYRVNCKKSSMLFRIAKKVFFLLVISM